MWSGAVGRYTMNSDKALIFDIKTTFAKELRCQRSAGPPLLGFLYSICPSYLGKL